MIETNERTTRIGLLVTVPSWEERRHFHRQAPALAVPGHDVFYIAADPGRQVTDRFRLIGLSSRDRRLSRLTGAMNLLRRILALRLDVLQLCSIEQLPLGLFLKAASQIKVVYDCREDMVSSMRDHRDRFPRWVRIVMGYATRAIEYLGARTFDGMVVSDPALYAMHYAMPPSRKVVFFNTPQLLYFRRDYSLLAEREYDVALMGSMSMRTGLTTLVDALGILKRRGRRVSALLLGQPDPVAMNHIRRRVEETDIASQVTVTGRVDHLEVPALLSTARIGTVPLLDMPKFCHNIACKAFEYMACGMPCVCSDLPPQRLFVREGVSGLFFPAGDAQALADRIAELLDDLPRAQRMGDAGRKQVETTWNCEREQVKYRVFYDRIAGRCPVKAGGSSQAAATGGGDSG